MTLRSQRRQGGSHYDTRELTRQSEHMKIWTSSAILTQNFNGWGVDSCIKGSDSLRGDVLLANMPWSRWNGHGGLEVSWQGTGRYLKMDSDFISVSTVGRPSSYILFYQELFWRARVSGCCRCPCYLNFRNVNQWSPVFITRSQVSQHSSLQGQHLPQQQE